MRFHRHFLFLPLVVNLLACGRKSENKNEFRITFESRCTDATSREQAKEEITRRLSEFISGELKTEFEFKENNTLEMYINVATDIKALENALRPGGRVEVIALLKEENLFSVYQRIETVISTFAAPPPRPEKNPRTVEEPRDTAREILGEAIKDEPQSSRSSPHLSRDKDFDFDGEYTPFQGRVLMGMDLGDRCQGHVLTEDTALVGKWIRSDDVKAVIPRGVFLAWHSTPVESSGAEFWGLAFLQKSPNDPGGDDLKKANASRDNSGNPCINLGFTDEGLKKFKRLSGENPGGYFAFLADGKIIRILSWVGKLPEGDFTISGNFSEKEAREIATQLNGRELPCGLRLLSVRKK